MEILRISYIFFVPRAQITSSNTILMRIVPESVNESIFELATASKRL